MIRHFFSVSVVLAIGLTSAARADVRPMAPPIIFEWNQGQADPRVKFLARAGACRLFLTENAAVLAAPANQRTDALTMRLLHSNPKPQVAGTDQQRGVSNYLTGSDPANWITGVKQFARVRYAQVYPGVDLIYYGKDRRLEHDFIVAPGADYHQIQIRYDGAKSLRLEENGDLVVETPFGELREPRPVIFQEIGGKRKTIAGGYRLSGRDVSFRVDFYDRSQPLVIDPAYTYFSTYLGGSGLDQPTAIASDAQGNAYVTGFTSSSDFSAEGPYQAKIAGATNAFVTKLDGSTGAIIYSTYLGGNNSDTANQIKVDASGNAYIAGTTQSSNFPVTPGAFQMTLNGPGNAFIAKLNPAGNALVYSSYLGGSGGETARGLDVDAQGSAYVVGATFSRDFPVVATSFGFPSGVNAFIAKINPAGTALVYSGALGGSGFDCLESIAINALGEANVVGFTDSGDLATSDQDSRWPELSGGLDGWMAKLGPGGNIEYISYYGGSGDDILGSIAADPHDNVTVYITGLTSSFDFPTPSGALIGLTPGSTIPFVAKFQLPGLVFVADKPRVPPLAQAGPAPDDYSWLVPPPDDCPQNGGGWGPLLKNMKNNMKDYKKFNQFMDDAGTVARDLLAPFVQTGIDTVKMIKSASDFCDTSTDSTKARGRRSLSSPAANASSASPAPIYAVKASDGTPVSAPELPVGLSTSYTSVFGLAGGPFGSIFLAVQTNDTTLPISPAGAKAGAAAASGLTGYIIKLADAAPAATITSVVNGASFNASSPVAPGSLISLFGQFPGVTTASATSTPLPPALGGASVTINGTQIPLYYLNSTQINAQIPWEIAPGQATAVVTSGGTTSAPFAFTVAAASPGIFTYGTNRAVVQNQDYSLNTSTNGAAAGSYVTVYLTGGGAVNPPFSTGAPSPSSPLAYVSAPSSATIGGQPAAVAFLGMTPGIIGVVQANVKVPQLSKGDYSLVITIGGAQSNVPLVSLSGN